MIIDWERVLKFMPSVFKKDEYKFTEVGSMLGPKNEEEHQQWVT